MILRSDVSAALFELAELALDLLLFLAHLVQAALQVGEALLDHRCSKGSLGHGWVLVVGALSRSFSGVPQRMRWSFHGWTPTSSGVHPVGASVPANDFNASLRRGWMRDVRWWRPQWRASWPGEGLRIEAQDRCNPLLAHSDLFLVVLVVRDVRRRPAGRP